MQAARTRSPSLLVLFLFFCLWRLNADCGLSFGRRRNWKSSRVDKRTMVASSVITTRADLLFASVTCAKSLGGMRHIDAIGAAAWTGFQERRSCCATCLHFERGSWCIGAQCGFVRVHFDAFNEKYLTQEYNGIRRRRSVFPCAGW